MLHHVSLDHVEGLDSFVSYPVFLFNIELEDKSFQGYHLIFKHEIAFELLSCLKELVDIHNHQKCLTQKYSFCFDFIYENWSS